MEKYLFLFVDTFFSNSILSTNQEIAIHIMKIYENEYNKYLILLIFFAGTFLGILSNYIFGIIIKKLFISIPNIKNKEETKERIIKYGLLTDKYSIILCLFSPIDLYSKAMTFFFGFCSSRKFLFAFTFISAIRTLYCYFY
jgi:membrane protein YqaA with SNARE-associated domain